MRQRTVFDQKLEKLDRLIKELQSIESSRKLRNFSLTFGVLVFLAAFSYEGYQSIEAFLAWYKGNPTLVTESHLLDIYNQLGLYDKNNSVDCGVDYPVKGICDQLSLPYEPDAMLVYCFKHLTQLCQLYWVAKMTGVSLLAPLAIGLVGFLLALQAYKTTVPQKLGQLDSDMRRRLAEVMRNDTAIISDVDHDDEKSIKSVIMELRGERATLVPESSHSTCCLWRRSGGSRGEDEIPLKSLSLDS